MASDNSDKYKATMAKYGFYTALVGFISSLVKQVFELIKPMMKSKEAVASIGSSRGYAMAVPRAAAASSNVEIPYGWFVVILFLLLVLFFSLLRKKLKYNR